MKRGLETSLELVTKINSSVTQFASKKKNALFNFVQRSNSPHALACRVNFFLANHIAAFPQCQARPCGFISVSREACLPIKTL